jgi:HEAT repeat protein
MLEGLSKIQWGRLTHAYGPAADVPGYIRQLLDPDEKVRRDAMKALRYTVAHQGSRYRATAPAVPFVFEVLEHRRTADRDWLIELLLGFAVGNPEWSYPPGFNPGREFQHAIRLGERTNLNAIRRADWTEKDDDQISRMQLWEMDAYHAVLKRIGTFHRLTGDSDQKVRMAAVKALSWFPEAAKKSIALVRRAIQTHEDPNERANAILSLGTLDRYQKDESDVDRLTAELAVDRPYVIRMAAAFALAAILGKRLPAEALTVLLEILEDPKRASEEGSAISWSYDAVPGMAGMTITKIRPKATEPVLAALCRVAAKVDNCWHGAARFAALMCVAFRDPKKAPVRKDESTGWSILDGGKLTPVQLRAVEAIAAAPVWQAQPFNLGTIHEACWDYGMPWRPDLMQQVVEEGRKAVGGHGI